MKAPMLKPSKPYSTLQSAYRTLQNSLEPHGKPPFSFLKAPNSNPYSNPHYTPPFKGGRKP